VISQLNLEQLRKQAKDRLRERRAAGEDVKLADMQFELARELGFASWPKLKSYVERLALEQPFHTDLDYYEGRAHGIATTGGVSVAEARKDLAARHGFASWRALRSHVEAMQSGEEPPTPFVLAYRAVEANDRDTLVELLDRFPELVAQRGTNGNDLLGMAGDLEIVKLFLERGADPNRGNDYGWTKLHQAGYGDDRELAKLMLAAGGRTDLFARGNGGTPLIAALFWGHREVVDLLGREPHNLRVAAGLGDPDMIRELAGTPQAGRTAGSTAPTAASRPGSRRTTRRRSSTRRSSGRRSPTAWRPSACSRSWARTWTPTRTAARRSPGLPARAAPPRSERWSSSAPIPTGAAASAGRATATA
jgi:Ankyrin repeats (3 copies)